MTYKEEFITFMVRAGVLTFGDFVTKSGRKTPYFINTGNYKTGAQAAQLGDYYAACIQEHLPDGVDCLFGPAYKGIPLAVAGKVTLMEWPPPNTSVTVGLVMPAIISAMASPASTSPPMVCSSTNRPSTS